MEKIQAMMCPYEKRTGNCMAKQMCRYKHEMNTNAKVFIPKSKLPPGTKSIFTPLNPAPVPVEYVPPMPDPEEDVYGDEENEEYCEACKDCTCCYGFIYTCHGQVCQDLGVCQCKKMMEMEEMNA